MSLLADLCLYTSTMVFSNWFLITGDDGKRIKRSSSIVLWRKTKNTITQFEPILARLERAAASAKKHASIINIAEEWFAVQAAIFSKAPEDSDATATLLGGMLAHLKYFVILIETLLLCTRFSSTVHVVGSRCSLTRRIVDLCSVPECLQFDSVMKLM